MMRPTARDPLTVRFVGHLFALATRLLPTRFRRSHDAELREMFVLMARQAHLRRGAAGVVIAGLRSALDVAMRAPREHRAERAGYRVGSFSDLGAGAFSNLATDTRHALKALLKSPVYTSVVVTTQALGIGVNTAMFGIVNAVLLRPLSFFEPDRLVVFRGMLDGAPTDSGTIAYLNFIDARQRATSLDSSAAYDEWRVNITGTAEPQRLDGATVNAEFFDVLGVRPQLGRFFLAEEDVAGNDRVVVLSHGLWQRKFGGNASAIGTEVQLNGNPHVVVGVAPVDFEDPLLSGGAWKAPEIWRPLGFFGALAEDQPSRGSSSYTAIGRLAVGISLSEARTELQGIAAQLESAYPDNNAGVGMTLISLQRGMVGSARPSLLLLFAAVGLVMAIAVVNVASLVLTRAADRGRDTALRIALGASHRRLGQLFLAEGLLLSGLGGGLGIALAVGLARLFVGLAGGSLPRAASVQIDPSVLAFTAAVTILTGLACGVSPMLRSFRLDLQTALHVGGKGVALRGGDRGARRALVVAEVAFALVLLVGAGLLIRSFWNLTHVEHGIESSNLLFFDISLPAGDYPDAADSTGFFTRLTAEIEREPGIEAAASVNILPLSGNFDGVGHRAADRPPPPPNQWPSPQVRTVTPGYFAVMGIELVSGRLLNERDVPDSERVAVVNETFAEELWPGEDPLGRELLNYEDSPITVVGVVKGVKHLQLDEAPEPAMYVAHPQGIIPWHTRRGTLVAKTASRALDQVAAARAVVQGIDPNLPVADLRTMDGVLDAAVASPRFRTMLLTSFAALALTLAVIGVYGVIAYSVSHRLREVAIRLALGGQRRQVLSHLLRDSLSPVWLGVALGLGLSVAMARLLEGMLFGVPPLDLAAFATVAVLLTGIATTAAWIPARRALRVDPMTTLRDE